MSEKEITPVIGRPCQHHQVQRDIHDDVMGVFCTNKQNQNHNEGNCTKQDCPRLK